MQTSAYHLWKSDAPATWLAQTYPMALMRQAQDGQQHPGGALLAPHSLPASPAPSPRDPTQPHTTSATFGHPQAPYACTRPLPSCPHGSHMLYQCPQPNQHVPTHANMLPPVPMRTHMNAFSVPGGAGRQLGCGRGRWGGSRKWATLDERTGMVWVQIFKPPHCPG